MAKLTSHKTFTNNSVIEFDKVIVNIGRGYFSDSADSNYGKFIAPVAGSYQFIAAVYNDSSQVGAFLRVNGSIKIQARNGPGGGTGMVSHVAKLEKNDQVYLTCPGWGANQLNRYFSFFSGHLIHPDI